MTYGLSRPQKGHLLLVGELEQEGVLLAPCLTSTGALYTGLLCAFPCLCVRP